VTLLSASAFGKLEAKDGQREMVLPLDGIAGIAVQFQGRRVFVRSDELFAALSGKEA
jgi:hypothetical protein